MAKQFDITYDPDYWLAVHKKEVPLPPLFVLKQEWYRGVTIACGEVKDDEPISAPWAGFVVGTPKMAIWYWFDQAMPNGLIADLMPELLTYSNAQMQATYNFIQKMPDGFAKTMNLYFFQQWAARWKLSRGVR